MLLYYDILLLFLLSLSLWWLLSVSSLLLLLYITVIIRDISITWLLYDDYIYSYKHIIHLFVRVEKAVEHQNLTGGADALPQGARRPGLAPHGSLDIGAAKEGSGCCGAGSGRVWSQWNTGPRWQGGAGWVCSSILAWASDSAGTASFATPSAFASLCQDGNVLFRLKSFVRLLCSRRKRGELHLDEEYQEYQEYQEPQAPSRLRHGELLFPSWMGRS